MLISERYKEMNKKLHRDYESYGTSGHQWANVVRDIAALIKVNEVLDYGCGKSTLKEALRNEFTVYEYDPAIEGKDDLPEPCDLVVCGDVLEHIEPECINDVLKDLKRVISRTGFFVISTRPAKKILSDGRNAHLLQKDLVWWVTKLSKHWNIQYVSNKRNERLHVIVEAKK